MQRVLGNLHQLRRMRLGNVTSVRILKRSLFPKEYSNFATSPSNKVLSIVANKRTRRGRNGPPCLANNRRVMRQCPHSITRRCNVRSFAYQRERIRTVPSDLGAKRAERERAKRDSHLLTALLRSARLAECPVLVRNLSSRGIGARVHGQPPLEGEEVFLKLDGRELVGRVRWVRHLSYSTAGNRLTRCRSAKLARQ